jgi:hypothetical protein
MSRREERKGLFVESLKVNKPPSEANKNTAVVIESRRSEAT